MDILDFKQLIVSLANRSVIKNEDKEDLIQDLWVKILSIDKSLLPENREEAFKFMKTVFSNYIKNWRRCFIEHESIDEYLLLGILSVKEEMSNQVETKQLFSAIQLWLKKQSTDIQTIVNELLDPSPLVLEIIHNSKLRRRHSGYIPPYTLIKIFGVNSRTWRDNSLDLHQYLKRNEYI